MSTVSRLKQGCERTLADKVSSDQCEIVFDDQPISGVRRLKAEPFGKSDIALSFESLTVADVVVEIEAVMERSAG